MKTMSNNNLWGGFVYYPVTEIPQLLEASYFFGEQAGTKDTAATLQDQHSSRQSCRLLFSQSITLMKNRRLLQMLFGIK
jgi:hypothetical protein